MKYQEIGFRGIYKQFLVFMLTDKLVGCIEGFPKDDKVNCILTYGYIDRQTGIRAEILAAGNKDKDKYYFFDGSSTHRSFLLADVVNANEFVVIDDKDDTLKKRYSDKIDIVNGYNESEDIEKTRFMAFLDKSRHELYPDDITVYLTGENLHPEQCWARLSGLGENYIIGTLLNEPYQKFGCHQGDRIAIGIQKLENGDSICVSNSKPISDDISEYKEFEQKIKTLISDFEKEQTQEKFAEILKNLHYSYVWFPCEALIDERNKENKVPAGAFKDHDNIIMIPKLLQGGKDGENTFFPVFSSSEEMEPNSAGFSKVHKRFVEVVSLAKETEGNLKGIIVNPFSDQFFVSSSIFDVFVEYIEKEEL